MKCRKDLVLPATSVLAEPERQNQKGTRTEAAAGKPDRSQARMNYLPI
jgi:hypothetical protein